MLMHIQHEVIVYHLYKLVLVCMCVCVNIKPKAINGNNIITINLFPMLFCNDGNTSCSFCSNIMALCLFLIFCKYAVKE